MIGALVESLKVLSKPIHAGRMNLIRKEVDFVFALSVYAAGVLLGAAAILAVLDWSKNRFLDDSVASATVCAMLGCELFTAACVRLGLFMQKLTQSSGLTPTEILEMDTASLKRSVTQLRA